MLRNRRGQVVARSITLQDTTSVPANGQVPNILQETRLVQTPHSGLLTLWVNAAAAGLRAQLLVGNDQVLIDSEMNTRNRLPVADEDWILMDVPCKKGDRITFSATNTTGAAVVLQWRVTLSAGPDS